MSIDIDSLLTDMLGAAATSFGKDWKKAKGFAKSEFRKIGMQLADIAENVAKFKLDNKQGYSPETGKVLLQMQRNATESVLVALTALTLITVRNALEAVWKVLKKAVGAALSAVF